MNPETINVVQAVVCLICCVGIYARGHRAGRKAGITEVFESVRKGDSYETDKEVIYGEVLPV